MNAANGKVPGEEFSCEAFLEEVERRIHLACVLLLQSGTRGVELFEGKREEGVVIWQKNKDGRSRLKMRLKSFTDGGSAIVLLRCLTRSLDAKTQIRLKNVYGWKIKALGTCLSAGPIQIQELQNLCSKDLITGEATPIGTDLVFRVGKSISG